VWGPNIGRAGRFGRPAPCGSGKSCAGYECLGREIHRLAEVAELRDVMAAAQAPEASRDQSAIDAEDRRHLAVVAIPCVRMYAWITAPRLEPSRGVRRSSCFRTMQAAAEELSGSAICRSNPGGIDAQRRSPAA
jgi:hypothetical protein